MDVRILGALEATDGERGVDLGLRKARMAFGALALQRGAPVPIAHLAEAIWPAGPPARWESAVYSHISRLRRALEPARAPGSSTGRIETLGNAYVLHLDVDELDAQRFERRGAEGRAALGRGDPGDAREHFDAALAEWRGPVLADLGDPPFAANEAHRLEELRRVVVEERIEAALALGQHAAAVVELEQLVAEHPLRERAWELLLLALYRSGRQADALRRYQEVRAILVDELGIEPGPGLRDLEVAILRHDHELRAERGSDAITARAGTSPVADGIPVSVLLPAWLGPADDSFIGRRDEVAALLREWESIEGRRRRLVLVTGEPGIGKTRLVREACAHIARDRATVLGGRCPEEPTHVLEPFAEALGRLVSAAPARVATADTEALAGLVPGIAPGTRAIDVEDQQYRVFRAVCHALDSRVLGAPAVLVLDDVQWARAPTLQLLSHLLRADDAGPLLVIATHRDTEPSGDLDALVADLHREHRLRRIGLVGLDSDEAVMLARARGSFADAEAIADMTEGNPFYVEELVRHVAESGGLLGPESVPESVRDTIALRLLRLSDAVRRVLGIAAVAGLQFDLDVVAEASGIAVDAPDAVDDALSAAARVGMVAEHPRRVGSYTFSHALIRTVLREGLGAARQARIHRRLGEAIAARHPDRQAEAAHHLLAAAADGSDAMPGIRCARDAATQAVDRYAYDDAAALLDAALQRLPAGRDQELRCRLVLDLTRVTFLTGHRYDDVRGLLKRATTIADELGDPAISAQVLIESSRVNIEEDQWARRVEALLHRLDEGSPERIVLTAMVALHWSTSPGDRGRRLAEWALARCTALDAPARKVVLDQVQPVLDAWSPPERVLDIARRGRIAAIESGDQRFLVTALAGERRARLAMGDLAGSDEVGREYEALADSLRQPRYRAGVAQRRAMRALLAGRFAEAEVRAEESIALQPTDEFIEGYAVQLFALRFLQGRLGEVRLLLEAWAAQYERPAWGVGLGLLAAELEDHEAARSLLAHHVAARYADIPRDDLWFLALAAAATATELLRDSEGAAVLYELLAPHASRVVVAGQGALCWGSLHGWLAPLAAILGADEQTSMHFESAMVMHARLGAQPFLARDRLGFARFLRDTGGDEARARDLARTGLAIARELGMETVVRRSLDLEQVLGL